MICSVELKGMSGVYLITNLVNGKIYVGSTVDLFVRFKRHKTDLNKGIHPNFHLLNAWNKYGEEKFSFTVLELVTNKDKLIEREQYWIDNLNVCNENIGYNINPIAGSTLGRKQSDEEIEKRRLLNNRPILQFDVNGNLIKEWYSAKEMSKELKINRVTIISRIKSKNKFNNSYFIYKDEFTDDLLKEVLLSNKSLSNAKKVNQYDENGIFIQTWDSIKLAGETLCIQANHISDVCKGKYKKSGGFIWKYAD